MYDDDEYVEEQIQITKYIQIEMIGCFVISR